MVLAALGYTFNNPDLLVTALTHRSRGMNHNERLEFLGDSIVNFVIAEALFNQFETASEGELSRWRASLVNREALADLARQLNLGEHLLLGPGELRSGGQQRESILSCAMEAIIGAIYLDGGFVAAQNRIMHWYQDKLSKLLSAAEHKDPKTVLQEFLQAKRLPLPVYSVDKITGEAHQQTFYVKCHIEGVAQTSVGQGTSRRRAEQDAAQSMLGLLKNDN